MPKVTMRKRASRRVEKQHSSDVLTRPFPYQIIGLLHDEAVGPQSSRFLAGLMRSGRVVDIFGNATGEVGRETEAENAEPLPRAISIGARNEDDARSILESMQSDEVVSTCYVAPPRFMLGRASQNARAGSNRPSSSSSRSDWGMKATGAGASLVVASGVLVGVVDSGADWDHPDLKGAIVEYENFTQRPDGDEEGHGTHVCGIIAGTGAAPQGMTGVCNAKLLVCKGITAPYDAPSYLQALEKVVNVAAVINLSVGGHDEDLIETFLIRRALRRGAIVVAAIGNDFECGNHPQYPAALDGVIAVGAVDQQMQRAVFSNTGDHIRIAAPGTEIWSTVPLHPTRLFTQTGYAPCDGTSWLRLSSAAHSRSCWRPDRTWRPRPLASSLLPSIAQGRRAGTTNSAKACWISLAP